MWRFGLDVVNARQERVHARQGRRDQHPHPLASRAQSLRKSKAAAERVSIGILVPKDQDLVVRVDELLDLVEQVGNLGLGGGYGVVPSSPPSTVGGRTSLSSSAMWTLYSIEGSISNRSPGENLRFCRRFPSSWRIKALADTRPA